MIPTPSTSHLKAADFESVYEPAGELVLSLTHIDLSSPDYRGNRGHLHSP